MNVFVTATGPLLELCALLLLVRRALWRVYPALAAYVVWILIGNTTLLVTELYFHRFYPAVYWHSDSIDIVLRFLVVWEVFRQTFPKTSGLNRTLSKGLGIIALGLLLFACATFWGVQNYANLGSASAQGSISYIHLALDRSFGFIQALMILGVLLMGRYYGLSCGRNVRGIALAFGAWVSLSTANNAMADLTNSFLPYWSYLRPWSFGIMLVVWIWALWVYDPNPPIVESEASRLDQWTEDWNRTNSIARSILRP
jgi:hypothetical protein